MEPLALPKPKAIRQPTDFQRKIDSAVSGLEPGEVVSFGDIAARAGNPKASRAVGSYLANSGGSIPWWRVIYASGYLPPCNPSLQAERLMEEGVQLKGTLVVNSPSGRFANE